ncbi:DEK C terminal domain-containing protein [Colletotrichum higginsianum]|nr:DEK C terminal domain-containing protein [Colletotrichum higginsianum]
MSLPLSSEEENNYTSIIDGILATADLTTITRKKIRLGLEKALGGKDLSDQKVQPPSAPSVYPAPDRQHLTWSFNVDRQ